MLDPPYHLLPPIAHHHAGLPPMANTSYMQGDGITSQCAVESNDSLTEE